MIETNGQLDMHDRNDTQEQQKPRLERGDVGLVLVAVDERPEEHGRGQHDHGGGEDARQDAVDLVEGDPAAAVGVDRGVEDDLRGAAGLGALVEAEPVQPHREDAHGCVEQAGGGDGAGVAFEGGAAERDVGDEEPEGELLDDVPFDDHEALVDVGAAEGVDEDADRDDVGGGAGLVCDRGCDPYGEDDGRPLEIVANSDAFAVYIRISQDDAAIGIVGIE